jgi:hypothetical protein
MAAAPTDSKDADTYGWDTVFATNFTHANAAITAGWPRVDAKAKTLVQASPDDPAYHIDATLGPWQLTTGGDGKNVRLSCPITAGSYTTPKKVYALDGVNVAALIEIGMEWVPDPGQFAFVISGNEKIDPVKADLDKGQIDAALQAAFAQQKRPLSNAATAAVQLLGKEWLVTDAAAKYYIFFQVDKTGGEFLNVYQFSDAWKVNLQALQNAVKDGDPAVVLVNVINNPTSGIAADVLADLLTTWFNINIGEFNYVFSILDLSPVVAKQTNYTWMLPTATSYAVTDQGTLDSSVFGVLTMVQNNAAGMNHQVSPYAIPTGADAGFLISGPNFMKNMLLAGAQLIFNNAPAESFDITNDGLTIMNNARILFGKFHLDDNPKVSIADVGYSAQLDNTQLPQGLVKALLNSSAKIDVSGDKVSVTDKGSQWLLSTGNANDDEYIVNKKDGNLEFYLATSLYVEAKKFQMSLNHTWVQIQFIDVTYPYNSDWDTHVTYSENVPLGLKDGTTNKVFWFGQAFARSLVTEVTQTRSAITREIVEDAIMGALALVAIVGPIVEGLRAGAAIGEISEDAGIATIEEEDWVIVQRENPQAAEEDEAAAGQAAARSSRGRWGSIKNAFKQPRWKFVGALAALAGGLRGLDAGIDEILKKAALSAWNDIPGFDDFAQTAIAPYAWPNIPGFTLMSAGLAGSLQIGMTVKPGN